MDELRFDGRCSSIELDQHFRDGKSLYGSSIPFEAGIFGTGKIRRLCRRVLSRARAREARFMNICFDVLMAKRAMPRVPDVFIDKCLCKHAESLCVPRVRPADFDKVVVGVKARIRAICGKLFAGKKLRTDFFAPSQNACLPDSDSSFGGGRVDGGAFGTLISEFLAQRKGDLPELIEAPLVMMGYTEPDAPGFKNFAGCRAKHCNQLWCEFMEYVERSALFSEDRPVCRPSPICEPLKVRVITMGPPAEYLMALWIQKTMHSVMRKTAPFRYIGRPIDEEDWQHRWEADVDSVVEGDKFFVSGDYSAATDGLDPSISEYAMERVLYELRDGSTGERLIDTHWRTLATKTLTGHVLKYDYSIFDAEPTVLERLSKLANARSIMEGKKKLLLLDQAWGQLMGSPVSFPILSIVNAAASSSSGALNISMKKLFADKGSGFCVNGDDIAFCADRE